MTRYPLSGEFAADAQFLGRMGLAADWGLEIGMLCDVFRHTPAQRFCQVDLGGNFDHKHQHLGYHSVGTPDPGTGLAKMAREVTRALLAHLWNDLGFSAEPRKLERLADAYLATAQVLLTRYKHETIFNNLESVGPEEQRTVKAFSTIVRQVAGESLATRPASSILPSWENVLQRLPVVAASLRMTAR
jgi:glucosyl-3-phosphoglycerate synthase